MSIKMKVTISKDANIIIDGIKNIMGPNCEKLTAGLESQGKVISKKKTDDYYKDPSNDVSINNEVVS